MWIFKYPASPLGTRVSGVAAATPSCSISQHLPEGNPSAVKDLPLWKQASNKGNIPPMWFLHYCSHQKA